MSNETTIELTERRASGYGPDAVIVLSIPHDRGSHSSDSSNETDIPSVPLRAFESHGLPALRWWCGDSADYGGYEVTAFWIPERQQWAGYSRHFTYEGWRGCDESIQRPFFMSAAFTAHVRSYFQRLEEIAYRNWVRRGRPIGDPLRDWLAAEEELGK